MINKFESFLQLFLAKFSIVDKGKDAMFLFLIE